MKNNLLLKCLMLLAEMQACFVFMHKHFFFKNQSQNHNKIITQNMYIVYIYIYSVLLNDACQESALSTALIFIVALDQI